jgi:hypothetical protein
VTAKSARTSFAAVLSDAADRAAHEQLLQRASPAAKPPGYYHLYGGGVGGPIVKNRTFFWFATEGYQSNTTRGISVSFPTAAERAGDFSNFRNSAGQLIVIYDPLTTRTNAAGQLIRDPFLGNKIPTKRLNPVSVNMMKYIRCPTRTPTMGARRTTRGRRRLSTAPRCTQGKSSTSSATRCR